MQEGTTAVFTVRDAEPTAVEALLHFCYTGKAFSTDCVLDPANMLELAVLRAGAHALYSHSSEGEQKQNTLTVEDERHNPPAVLSRIRIAAQKKRI